LWEGRFLAAWGGRGLGGVVIKRGKKDQDLSPGGGISSNAGGDSSTKLNGGTRRWIAYGKRKKQKGEVSWSKKKGLNLFPKMKSSFVAVRGCFCRRVEGLHVLFKTGSEGKIEDGGAEIWGKQVRWGEIF